MPLSTVFSVRLRSKKRGTRVKHRVKNRARIGVGTPTKSLLAFSDLLARKNFLFEFSMNLSVTTCILPAKRFFSRFRATSREQENKEARHSGITAYKKKSSSFTYRRRFPFVDLTVQTLPRNL